MFALSFSAMAQTSGDGWEITDWTLTISESQVIGDNSPWEGYNYDKVVIKSGVTEICRIEKEIPVIYEGTFSNWLSIKLDYYFSCLSLSVGGEEISGDIVIPEGITEIGNASLNVGGLTSVTIPVSVNKIGQYALPKGIKLNYLGTLEEYSLIDMEWQEGFSLFCNGEEITEYRIPSGTETYTGYNFQNCTSLVDIYVPSSLKAFKDAYFYNPNKEKRNVYYDGDVKQWCSIKFGGSEDCSYCGSAIFDYNYDLYFNNEKVTDLVIPSTVESVPDAAFSGANIETVILEEGVREIRAAAFSACGMLSDIYLPNSLVRIGVMSTNNCFIGSITYFKRHYNIYYNGSTNDFIKIAMNTDSPYNIWYIGSGNTFSVYFKGEAINELIIDSNTPSDFHNIISPFQDISSIKKTTCLLQTPPDKFANLVTTQDVYIPYGTTDAYKDAWGTTFNYIEMEPEATSHKVSLYTENSGVHFGNYVFDGSNFSTLIEVQDGYKISEITINGVDASADLDEHNILTAKNITADITIVVSFETENSTLNRSLEANMFRAWRNGNILFVEIPDGAKSVETFDVVGRREVVEECEGYCVKNIRTESDISIVKVIMKNGSVFSRKL